METTVPPWGIPVNTVYREGMGWVRPAGNGRWRLLLWLGYPHEGEPMTISEQMLDAYPADLGGIDKQATQIRWTAQKEHLAVASTWMPPSIVVASDELPGTPTARVDGARSRQG